MHDYDQAFPLSVDMNIWNMIKNWKEGFFRSGRRDAPFMIFEEWDVLDEYDRETLTPEEAERKEAEILADLRERIERL